MADHLHWILAQRYTQRDVFRWVLDTVIQIDGSNCPKAGTMRLIRYLRAHSDSCIDRDTHDQLACFKEQKLSTALINPRRIRTPEGESL